MSRLFSIRDLIDITRKSDKTIKKKLETLAPTPGPKGAKLYDSAQALALIYADVGDLSTERAKLTVLQQEKLEIEIAKIKGEVVAIEDVAKTVEKEYSFVRAHIRQLPSKLAKPLSMVTDPHEVHAAISEAVDECLTELTADATYAKQVAEKTTELDTAPRAEGTTNAIEDATDPEGT